MQARRLQQDAVKKPKANPKASQCAPLTFSYESSPSGIDSNLLILLHGLGDTHLPFQSLGKKLATNLPQTATLSLRGGSPVPFLEEQGWGWWDVWDDLGQDVPQPNPTKFLDAFNKLLDYLTKDTVHGGCGWPSSNIHLFGFGQGGAAALEGALAWTREQRGASKITEMGKELEAKAASELGSIVNICGTLLSHPTFSPALQVPVLCFHRQRRDSGEAKKQLESIRRGFSNVQEANFPSLQIESMPQSQAEWTTVMSFWSRLVRNRGTWELEGEVYSMGGKASDVVVEDTKQSTSTASWIGWSPTAEEKGR